MKYSPFLSQFPKTCFDGNTLTFLERRKTRELQFYLLWAMNLRDGCTGERKEYLFFTHRPVHSLGLCNEGWINRKEAHKFIQYKFYMIQEPLETKQNKEIRKPLHFKAKFHNEGDNRAEVLDKEVGPRDDTLEDLVRPCDHTLEDLARPRDSILEDLERPDGSDYFLSLCLHRQTSFLQVQSL